MEVYEDVQSIILLGIKILIEKHTKNKNILCSKLKSQHSKTIGTGMYTVVKVDITQGTGNKWTS